MHILVTGGCGFIGSNLCRILQKDTNNYIICLDDLTTGRKENIKDLLNKTNFKFVYCDIVEDDILKNIDFSINQIYHLACPASPKKYQIDPVKTIKINTIGTINILEFAVKKNAKVLFSSTSEIYGDPIESPQTETYFGNVNPVGPRSCYDEGKRISETLMMEYRKKYNLDTKIVRIFNTYGPYLDKTDGRVVSNFINQAISNNNITIYGNGNQTRSFCYIDDLLEGLIKMMTSKEKGPINLGNPNEITVNTLAETIIKIVNSESTVINCELPIDDPKIRKPNIEKANKLLQWNPKIDLETGLRLTINYFKHLD